LNDAVVLKLKIAESVMRRMNIAYHTQDATKCSITTTL